MDGTEDDHVNWNKPDEEKYHILSHPWIYVLKRRYESRRGSIWEKEEDRGRGGRTEEGNGVKVVKAHAVHV
jgi:hypothetical protein